MHWLHSTGYRYLRCSGVLGGANASKDPQLLPSPSFVAASFLLPVFGELFWETGDAIPASSCCDRLPLGPRRISSAKTALGSNSSFPAESSFPFLCALMINLRTAVKNLLLPPDPDPSPAIFVTFSFFLFLFFFFFRFFLLFPFSFSSSYRTPCCCCSFSLSFPLVLRHVVPSGSPVHGNDTFSIP